MSKNRLINDIVRKTAFTVPPTAYLSEVYRLMKNRSLAHVTVLENHEIVGIISRKAIKQLGFGYEFDGHDDVETGMFDMLQANQVMERNPPQIALSATVGEVAALMAKGAYTALPVVYEDQPVGIIDINDIVLFLLETP
ncbi:CBS domain-containing protein [Parapedobacter sp.]